MNPRPILAAVAMLCAGLVSNLWSASAQTPGVAPKPRTGAIIITNTPLGGNNGKGKTTPYLSAGLADVLKLHQAGVDESVLLAFVQSSSVAYHPSAKEVIYLRDQGISQNVMTALLKRGGELRERAAETEREERSRAVPPPAAPVNPQPGSAAPAVPAQPAAAEAAPAVYYTTPAYAPTYVTPVYSYYGYGGYGYGYGCSYPVYPYAGFGSWRYPGYGCYSYSSPWVGVGFSYRWPGPYYGFGVSARFGSHFSGGYGHYAYSGHGGYRGGYGGIHSGYGGYRGGYGGYRGGYGGHRGYHR